MWRSTKFVVTTVGVSLLLTGNGHADVIPYWPYEKLMDQAELVVIATPIKTSTGKKDDVPPGAAGKVLQPIRTEFRVEAVLKGKVEKQILVLHYELRKDKSLAIDRRIELITFPSAQEDEQREASEERVRAKKKEYILFLKQRGEGVFVFVTGEWDAKLAVREIVGLE